MHTAVTCGAEFDKDYVLLESEVDVRQHCSERGHLCRGVASRGRYPPGQPEYNPVDYQPQYWFLNGLSFPKTIHAAGEAWVGWSDWIASHPGYDPFITGSVGERDKGSDTHDQHRLRDPTDAHAWFPWQSDRFGPTYVAVGPDAFGLGTEKQTLTIGSERLTNG